MASWMIHLRIAQALSDKRKDLPLIPLIMGNLAPDSGVPTDDGHGFIPDKHISHFSFTDDRGKMHIHPEKFEAQYLSAPPQDMVAYSFYIGYYTHLVTDRQWIEEIYPLGIASFPALYQGDKKIFAATIKADWYDMDFKFLKAHPDFPAWAIYQNAPPFKNQFLDFFSEDAIESRKSVIMEFYQRGIKAYAERKNHLTDDDLSAFVDKTVSLVLDRFA